MENLLVVVYLNPAGRYFKGVDAVLDSNRQM